METYGIMLTQAFTEVADFFCGHCSDKQQARKTKNTRAVQTLIPYNDNHNNGSEDLMAFVF